MQRQAQAEEYLIQTYGAGEYTVNKSEVHLIPVPIVGVLVDKIHFYDDTYNFEFVVNIGVGSNGLTFSDDYVESYCWNRISDIYIDDIVKKYPNTEISINSTVHIYSPTELFALQKLSDEEFVNWFQELKNSNISKNSIEYQGDFYAAASSYMDISIDINNPDKVISKEVAYNIINCLTGIFKKVKVLKMSVNNAVVIEQMDFSEGTYTEKDFIQLVS